MQAEPVKSKADYGIDAPKVVRNFFLIGATSLLAGLALAGFVHSRSFIVSLPASVGIFGGASWVATAAIMVLWSKVLKLRFRERVLNSIEWRGNEQVLDIGCGRGLMLIGAAKRLTSGTATGIDLWQTEDQSGNGPEVTRANAFAEGVSDRIQIQTGDARQLPFEDNRFDVVTSSWALHNIYQADGRAQALCEIMRVLKPGGRLSLVDIYHAREYAAVLKQAGLNEVQVSRPNFLFVIPSRVVSGRKN